MSGYGSAPAPKGDDNGKPVDPKWVTSLREFTGAGTTSSERLDVAKFVFIMLVSSGHFLEPFYKIGNRGVGAYMHAIYGFHVPAFVLISGYVSGDLNPKRRRALIAGTIAPYVIMHVIFSLFYTRAFCEGEWTDERGHAECEFVNKWALMDPVVGRWDGWDKWTFAYPFAQMWYLVSLFTKRLWRPFALEMRWTLAVSRLPRRPRGIHHDRTVPLHPPIHRAHAVLPLRVPHAQAPVLLPERQDAVDQGDGRRRARLQRRLRSHGVVYVRHEGGGLVPERPAR
jgi:hypothetical protein